MQPLLNIWAKYSKEDPSIWHPLIYHMLDSYAVSNTLWEECLSESFKIDISNQFGLSTDEMGVLISFWVSLHDIGKAGPDFQKKNLLSRNNLENLGFTFPENLISEGFHGTATTIILRNYFTNYPKKFKNLLAYALGGHHGEFILDQDVVNIIVAKSHVGDENWQKSQKEIIEIIQKNMKQKEPNKYPSDLQTLNPIMLLITGLTTTADWIASSQEFFHYYPEELETINYLGKAESQALVALKALGWYGWKAKKEVYSFGQLFPGYTPNIIQSTVIKKTELLKSPFLMIIEAPTGSGKTEAALFTADTVIQRDQKAGIYIAMPTQATSNQMYTRVRSFLSKRYAENEINLHLVHGAAQFHNQYSYTPENVFANEDEQEANIRSQAWFLPRKRTLLAPFGVGTVDQTFLSVLRTKHFFLRLFGLCHKVIIFDEVHAYDVYMMEIFESLLHWLNAVGTSVIILTATLPTETRKALLKAYSGIDCAYTHRQFPRISIATNDEVRVENAGEVKSRRIKLDWIGTEPECITQVLKNYLSNGGCAAVICNRVSRAQEIYTQVKQAFEGEQIEIILFHSRFPLNWRIEIENKVLAYFGKDRTKRPQKAILIATQVIEQSLDLDFDLMISDLAPIDLMIQRIGRLHRHSNQTSIRPEGLSEPTFIITSKTYQQEIPDYGVDKLIYDAYFLAKTHITLKDRLEIDLPSESDALIEKVYTLDDDLAISQSERKDLEKLKDKMLEEKKNSQEKSHLFLIPETKKNLFGSLQTFFGDDRNSISSRIINAPTREIEPNIDVVCIRKEEDELHILNDPNKVDLENTLTNDQISKCIGASLSINNRKVLGYLLETGLETPKGFRSSAALRWHFPLIFENNIFETDQFKLELTRESGLLIRIENQK